MTIEEFTSQVRNLIAQLNQLSATQWILWAGGFAGAYLIGSISFAYILSKKRGVDLRQQGSGNLGATNVFRVLGPKAGIIVFSLDVLKGVLPALVAAVLVGPPAGFTITTGWLQFLNHVVNAWRQVAILGDLGISWRSLAITYGVGAIFGHMYPFYLGFKGGKAVATGCGVFLVLAPVQTITAALIWLVVLMISRYVSLSSMIAAVVLFVQILAAHLFKDPQKALTGTTYFAGLVCLMIILRHRGNIRRLMNGTEPRLVKAKPKRRPRRARASSPAADQANDSDDNANPSSPAPAQPDDPAGQPGDSPEVE